MISLRRLREAQKLWTRSVRSFSSNSASDSRSTPQNVKLHQLESVCPNNMVAVQMRRDFIARENPILNSNVAGIPMEKGDFDDIKFYEQIHGVNCENVIGFLPLPVGVVGPLMVNDEEFFVPMATTEGALLASVNRGATVIKKSGGCFSTVIRDGMTRAPVVELDSAAEAVNFAHYIESEESFAKLKAAFESTTSHGKLLKVDTTVAGRLVYIRFEAFTGDAMGMNMIGKGVNKIFFDDDCRDLLTKSGIFNPRLISLSSNMCTDKKPSAINWVSGRGKSVVCEATIPESLLKRVLKVSVEDMVNLNTTKNLVGSSLAGSIGGNNAHSSNIVTALFLATGQDPAQNVESSNCMLLMKKVDLENDEIGLNISVTMPTVEVGTVGGGTSLPAQQAALKMLGVARSDENVPGKHARKLSEIVAASVLAGEISLNAALCSNQLISAHMQLNRK